MTLTETLKAGLAEAGIPSTVRYGAEGDIALEISDSVDVEVMPEMVELGGRPYMVMHPGFASPTLATPADVAAYLRKENLL